MYECRVDLIHTSQHHHLMHSTHIQVLDVAEYMESRRKDMDKCVQGEHRWLGDTDASTLMDSLSYNPYPVSWYLK